MKSIEQELCQKNEVKERESGEARESKEARAAPNSSYGELGKEQEGRASEVPYRPRQNFR